VRLGDVRPGSLSQQYNVCGNPRCRCKATPPRKHGPVYQLSYTWGGKSTTRHVRKEDVPQVKQQLRNYRRLRTLVERWVTLGMELSHLTLQEQHDTGRPVSAKRGGQSRRVANNKG
jgi:hypothetical protein